ncbi:MAG: enoyl-CoA hydratase/isomerase [Hyphomonadaceae bacterium]
MAPKKLQLEISDGVAVITLNDPATLNAASTQLIEELAAALRRAAAEARAAILTGAGRAFSAGGDLSAGGMGGQAAQDRDIGERLESHINPLMTFIRDMPVPLVTAVNGPAAGVGCSLAIAGDFIVAAESAYFLQAFRRIGLVPDGGSTYMLPRMIGRARAMEMMLLGDRIPAQQAAAWGLVNRCVPDADLMTTAHAYARQLADGPRSLALIRKIVWQGLDQHWAAQLQLERETQREAGRTADFVEGVSAFQQKRPAKFTGR